MRQDLLRTCSAKLQSRRAETLSELLVSVLVIVLALTMFATALMAARKMLANGDQIINAYYKERSILEKEDSSYKENANLIFRVEDGTNYKAIGFAHKTGTANVGEYPVSLYSEQKKNATGGTANAEKYYRYSR